MNTPVVLVTGVSATAMGGATAGLQFDLPAAVVQHHAIEGSTERLHRTVSELRGVLERGETDLEHACVSCAIREDVVPTMLRLAELDRWGAIVVHLPVAADATQVCRMLALMPEAEELVRVVAVVAAVDGCDVVADLTTDDLLEERGITCFTADDRGVAESLAPLIEYADLIAVSGDLDTADVAYLDALRHPGSRIVQDWEGLEHAELLAGALHDHAACERWVDPIRRDPLPENASEHVWRLDLASDRPFDPTRFLHHMEQLGAGPHRIRGCFWLPTRGADACMVDGAGGHVAIGLQRPWSPGEPRLTRLVVTGPASDTAARDRVRAAFASSLLTDTEIAVFGTDWPPHPDGLEPWLGEPDHAA